MENNGVPRLLGERIKALRVAQGLTQQQLADKLGRHQTSITKIEAGTQDTSISDLYALAVALGVGIEELVLFADDDTMELIRLKHSIEESAGMLQSSLKVIESIKQRLTSQHAELYDFVESHRGVYPAPGVDPDVTLPGNDDDYDGFFLELDYIECANV